MYSISQPKTTNQDCRTRVYSIYVLSMLLLTYLFNQLDRFLLGIVTKPMSQELGYGDWACMRNETVTQNAVVCNATNEHEYVCMLSAVGFHLTSLLFFFFPQIRLGMQTMILEIAGVPFFNDWLPFKQSLQ